MKFPGLTQLIQKFKLQGLDPITLIFHKSHPHQILMRYLNKKVPTKMKHQIHWLKTMIKMKKIGRASCRERVKIKVSDGAGKKKNKKLRKDDVVRCSEQESA